jgi:hypothetical protein
MLGHEKLTIQRSHDEHLYQGTHTRESEWVRQPVNVLVCECGEELARSTETFDADPAKIKAYRDHVLQAMITAEASKATIKGGSSQTSKTRLECINALRERRMQRILREGDQIRYIGPDPTLHGALMTVAGFDVFRSKIRFEDATLPHGKRLAWDDGWTWFGCVELVACAADRVEALV